MDMDVYGRYFTNYSYIMGFIMGIYIYIMNYSYILFSYGLYKPTESNRWKVPSLQRRTRISTPGSFSVATWRATAFGGLLWSSLRARLGPLPAQGVEMVILWHETCDFTKKRWWILCLFLLCGLNWLSFFSSLGLKVTLLLVCSYFGLKQIGSKPWGS